MNSCSIIKTTLFPLLLFPLLLFGGVQGDFFRACLHGDIEKVLILHEKEGMRLLFARDKDGNTPLHLACCSKKGGNKKEIVSFLISKGVDINATCNDGATPLIVAVSNGNFEAAELLVKAPTIQINKAFNHGLTPLHVAVINRFSPLISLILSHPECNPNFGTRDGATPLHFAAMIQHVEEARLLIQDRRVDLNAPQHDATYSGATPLHFAAMQAQTEIVKMMLQRGGVNVKATLTTGGYDGFTPLHFVVLNPDTVNVFETAKMLLRAGANPKYKSSLGKTPFDLTNVSIIQNLLKNPKMEYLSSEK
ncbi:MAG: ankyrin repeat domain-containing protein [Chlamydiia bacterium]|nr:ankyrin repeat domain-containing protein [Chlamydiia bacterium]